MFAKKMMHQTCQLQNHAFRTCSSKSLKNGNNSINSTITCPWRSRSSQSNINENVTVMKHPLLLLSSFNTAGVSISVFTSTSTVAHFVKTKRDFFQDFPKLANLIDSGLKSSNSKSSSFLQRLCKILGLKYFISFNRSSSPIKNYNYSKSTELESQNSNYLRTRKMSGNANQKGPGLIVFDLDCTLWPHHVDTTVNPPFIQKNDSKVVDQDGEPITFYPEVPQVLEYLQSEGYTVGVASRTTKPPAANQLLEFFDWNKYIKYKEIYPGSKVTHFSKFVEQTGLKHEDMLFFDDERRNIIDMTKEGVKCIFVKNGVDMKLVKDSIDQFKSGQLQ